MKQTLAHFVRNIRLEKNLSAGDVERASGRCFFLLIMMTWILAFPGYGQDGSNMRYVKPSDLTSAEIGKWVHLDFGKRSFAPFGAQRARDTISLEKYDGEKITFAEHRVDDGLNNWFNDQYLESTSTIDGLKVRWTKNKLLEINDTSITVQAYFDYMTPTGDYMTPPGFPVLGRSYSKKLSFPKSFIAEILVLRSDAVEPSVSLVPGYRASRGLMKIQFWDVTCQTVVSGVTVTGSGPTKIERSLSDRDGEVTFSDLKPGIYTLIAEKKGFARLEVTDIEIVAGTERHNAFQLVHSISSTSARSEMDSKPCE